MKRILLLLLGLAVLSSLTMPALAIGDAGQKTKIHQAKVEKNYYKDIQNVMRLQDKYVADYNIDGLKELYADTFVNNDGYNKEIYFTLVKETWAIYPDITYKTSIKNISVQGNYATVDTYETAVATVASEEESINVAGELHSSSTCRYHLERISDKWLISGEDVLSEYSALKFGDARYIKMNFSAPAMVSAGTPYTATLKVDLPADRIIIASINNEKIVNPTAKPEDKFRRLPEEQILERMFTANSENVNEYNIASVGITKTEVAAPDKVKVYMNGLAFIMTRVNVVPKNNFVKLGDSNE